MEISEYLKEIQKTYDSGEATEHSYRPALAKYLTVFFGKTISVINEPKRKDYGATDFIISKTNTEIPIGYIETKDINADLKKLETSEQLIRYKEALSNLILTNYLEFIYYKAGKEYTRIRIAELRNKKITLLKGNFDKFKTFLENFCKFKGQFIGTPQDLASIMAKKTKLMATAFQTALRQKEANKIEEHFNTFQQYLIPDITEERFASIYAETVTYGLFVAKLNSPKEFSRIKSHELIPTIFPFLKDFFTDIATRLEDNIRWVVDELCELLKKTKIENIVKDLGSLKKNKGKTDPVIYFYEDFLKQYNPKIRKARGIYYTPEAVVNFIVRAIDTVLKNHFNLPDGIADKSKVTIPIKEGKTKTSKEVHKVQLLDVATGTGSFLAEVIRQIHRNFQGQTEIWSSYVEEHLLPRLHGFEILMSAYAMCHLKIHLLLKETDYAPEKKNNPQRLKVYLANALEKPKEDLDALPIKNLLTEEAKAAAKVKKDTPVMVAFGNPPYNGESKNVDKFIMDLMKDYKKEPTEEKLKEKNSKWLNNDYIKFIRLGEHYITKNKEGILVYITSNSYLDGLIYRGMRWHLLNSFDSIYIVNLHGNSKKKETAPDGTKDENVFDITEGVAISIFIKNNKKQGNLADIFYLDSYGNREEKYKRLWEVDLEQKHFKKLKYKKPYYFFVPKDFRAEAEYKKGFKINELFLVNSVGIVTGEDKLFITYSEIELKNQIQEKFNAFDQRFIRKISYRPFDNKKIYYSYSKIARARNKVMRHMLTGNNFGLIAKRGFVEKKVAPVFITQNIIDFRSWSSAGMQGGDYLFPLYAYNDETEHLPDKKIKNANPSQNRNANLNPKIVREIEQKINLKFIADHELPEAQESGNFSPLDLLDYIYAVLHSPNYRKKYQEFLKIDFPRVPYPEDKEKFKKLAKIGTELRQTHLLTGEKFASMLNLIKKYPYLGKGNNQVEKIYFELDDNSSELGKVYINKTQYFGKVPKVAWDFFIGGYQPAQKWLKDRKDRILSSDEIEQYQKIILALKTTSDIMPQIDPILFS